jgi:hypothetical protein
MPWGGSQFFQPLPGLYILNELKGRLPANSFRETSPECDSVL